MCVILVYYIRKDMRYIFGKDNGEGDLERGA